MPLQIGGQLYCQLLIDGQEYPVTPSSQGLPIVVNQNVRQFLPVCTISVDDIAKQFSGSQPVNDGSQIQLSINDGSDSGSNLPPITYRAFGTPIRRPSINAPGVANYTMHGILDAIPYLRSAPNQAITGTSLDVMQQAASILGFNLITNVSPNDSMDWLPGRGTWATYLRGVVGHSYQDATSVMAHGVDEQYNLYFQNISTLLQQTNPKAYIYFGTPSDSSFSSNQMYPALEHKTINRSGMLNHWGGYGQRTTQVAATGLPSLYNQVQATQVDNSLDIDSSLAQQVSPVSRMVFSAMDCSNAHKTYISARHQNFRLKTTYSQNTYVLLAQSADLTLFDVVKFSAADESGQTDSSVSGLYIVTATTKVIQGTRYWMKVELTNAGPGNTDSSLE